MEDGKKTVVKQVKHIILKKLLTGILLYPSILPETYAKVQWTSHPPQLKTVKISQKGKGQKI